MDIGSIVVNALGFIGTAFSILMWIPQARITWGARNDPARLAGISETTQWLLTGSYLVWGVYGVLAGSLWIAAPSVVALPIAIASVVIVRRGRRLPLTVSVPIISADETHSNLDETHLDVATGSIPVTPVADELGKFDITTPIVVIPADAEAESTATGTIPILASEPLGADMAVEGHTEPTEPTRSAPTAAQAASGSDTGIITIPA
ncbi:MULTISPECIES: hypothetical protein [unclassified Salinibacterium]|uniref:hypothetical protein n=1 Tax=unclassified Salinibacterium TaxID=2632331 RepID=UPI00143D6D76|nr:MULTISPECIES: hypothetical protein [unclassified Salinibacterium]